MARTVGKGSGARKGPAARPARADETTVSAVGTYGVAPPILDEASLEAALARLADRDPAVVAHLVEVGGPPPLRRRPAGFPGLAQIIVGQQLSTFSAEAIFGRLHAALDPFTPEVLLATSEDALRALGLSGGKIRSLRAIAEATLAGSLPLDALDALPAEDAHRILVAVHGIGPWTADIFLLFCLGHADAWPAGDLALQEAARVALGLTARPSTQALHAIGDRWRPYRAVAARLLWAYYRALKGRSGMALTS